MTIEKLETYIKNLWDWGFLDECFEPTKIKVSDLDGIVERNGHFLLIEAKSPGKEVPRGQAIMFNRLIQIPQFHILIIWGETNAPQEAQLWGHNKMAADEKKVKEIVRRWFRYASNKLRPE